MIRFKKSMQAFAAKVSVFTSFFFNTVNFFLSFYILGNFGAQYFATFSLALLVQAFFLSLQNALIITPLLQSNQAKRDNDFTSYNSFNLVLASLAAVSNFIVSYSFSTNVQFSLSLCLLTFSTLFRAYLRSCLLILNEFYNVTIVDILLLCCCIFLSFIYYSLELKSLFFCVAIFITAQFISLIPIAREFQKLFHFTRFNGVRFVEDWRTTSKYSLFGTLSNEIAVNAHTYATAIFLGPASIALLSLSYLLMRPSAMLQQALLQTYRAKIKLLKKQSKFERSEMDYKDVNWIHVSFFSLNVLSLLVFIHYEWIGKPIVFLDEKLNEYIVPIVLITFIRGLRLNSLIRMQVNGHQKAIFFITLKGAVIALLSGLCVYWFDASISLYCLLAADLFILFLLKREITKDAS